MWAHNGVVDITSSQKMTKRRRIIKKLMINVICVKAVVCVCEFSQIYSAAHTHTTHYEKLQSFITCVVSLFAFFIDTKYKKSSSLTK
jgi:hypothetical protein